MGCAFPAIDFKAMGRGRCGGGFVCAKLTVVATAAVEAAAPRMARLVIVILGL